MIRMADGTPPPARQDNPAMAAIEEVRVRLDRLEANEARQAELRRTHGAPTARDLPGAIVDGHLSFRQCVQALEPIIRMERGKRRRN